MFSAYLMLPAGGYGIINKGDRPTMPVPFFPGMKTNKSEEKF
jgi:hypothetical protein